MSLAGWGSTVGNGYAQLEAPGLVGRQRLSHAVHRALQTVAARPGAQQKCGQYLGQVTQNGFSQFCCYV